MSPKPTTRVEAVLHELCVKYGYCLPPAKQQALIADPPADVDAFVDAVLVAEGLDPTRCDRQTRREIGDVVGEWLFDAGQGRGAKSGLSGDCSPAVGRD